MRISLTHEDFKTLVTGGVVKKEVTEPSKAGPQFGQTREVEIALNEIGFTVMLYELIRAKADKTPEEKDATLLDTIRKAVRLYASGIRSAKTPAEQIVYEDNLVHWIYEPLRSERP